MEVFLKKAFCALIACAIIFTTLPIAPAQAAGAVLYLYPNSGTYDAGKTFSVSVSLNTPDQAVNAVSGAVTFPTDKLEVVGLSKGSVMSLWVQEPAYSNANGTVSFEGVIFNPGFTGNGAQIIGITFRAKGVGDARVSIANASALANDGSGTNILSGVGGGTYTISIPEVQPEVEQPEAPAEEESEDVPVAGVPVIRSASHPDAGRWYPLSDVSLAWDMPDGADGVSYELDQRPDTVPDTRSEGSASGITLEDTADGNWYFHLRIRNAGGWSEVGHFPLQIDTVPPALFDIVLNVLGSEGDGRPTVYTNATDELSGLSRFEFSIGGVVIRSATPEEMTPEQPYRLPFRTPAEYPLSIRAFDAAGNSTTAETTLVISGFASPVITYYPEEIGYGEALTVKGETYPNALVTVRFTDEYGAEWFEEAMSNAEGQFETTSGRRLKPGVYAIDASVRVESFESAYSPAVTTNVVASLLGQLLDLQETLQTMYYIVILLLFLLLLVALYAWLVSRRMRLLFGKRSREAEEIFHEAFMKLREDVLRQIKTIEYVGKKRKVSVEEESIAYALKKDVEEVEEMVHKALKDMNRSVNKPGHNHRKHQPPKES